MNPKEWKHCKKNTNAVMQPVQKESSEKNTLNYKGCLNAPPQLEEKEHGKNEILSW
jgi:hypothetical protein